MPRKRKTIDIGDDGSKTERVYRDLRRRIRELDLPPGLQLDKNQIAEDYGVSRAPVSDAIARLATEGLVDVFPQSGSFVAPIRVEELRESLLIRTGLEVEVARRAAQLVNDTLCTKLDDNLDAQATAVKRNDLARLDDLDEAFHVIIMSAVGSPAAERLLDRTRAILDRPRFRTLPEEGRPRDTYTEHRRIALHQAAPPLRRQHSFVVVLVNNEQIVRTPACYDPHIGASDIEAAGAVPGIKNLVGDERLLEFGPAL
jgi:DNA-binding GntR family transcriptional regulator